MADVEEKKIILSTEAKTEQSATQLNALTNVIDHVSGAALKLMQVNLQLMQSNISVRNSVWALIDSKRALQRFDLQNIDLMRRQAALSIELAERQALITLRTGRQLDAKQALLGVENAYTAAALTNFDIETQRWNLQKQQIQAQEQENMALLQQRLLTATLAVQIGAMISQMVIMITLLWQRFAAETALLSLKTAGVGLGIAAVSVGSALALTKGLAPPAPKQGNPPPSGNVTSTATQTNFINVRGNIDSQLYSDINSRNETNNITTAGNRSRMAT
jgi:hypothetical protein